MPAQPQWLLHLPRIVEELSAFEAPIVDRAAIERVFGLRRRQAIYLMRAFGGYQLGKTALLDRRLLIERLREINGSEKFEFEHKRRERLTEQLERVRKQKRGARVVIPVDPAPAARPALPPGVRLEAGRLSVEFTNVQDLLAKLYGIAQAAAEDFASFETVAASGPRPYLKP